MTAIPLVQGHCPACGWSSLFLGAGGYITCSRLDCPAPDAASTLLEHAHEGGQWRVEFYDGGMWLPCSPVFDSYVAAVRHQQHLDVELPTWRDESVVRRRTVRCRHIPHDAWGGHDYGVGPFREVLEREMQSPMEED